MLDLVAVSQQVVSDSSNGGIPVWAYLVGTVGVGIIGGGGGIGAWRLAKRLNSGSVKDSDAKTLWAAAEALRGDLTKNLHDMQEEVKAAREENNQLREEIKEARAENRKLKAELTSTRRSMDKLRKSVVQLGVPIDALNQLLTNGDRIKTEEE